MPYLTRARLNPQRSAARRLLANPAAMKAAVYAGIAIQPVQERVLWRLDADNPLQPLLYVVSQSRPSLQHVIEQAGWPDADTPQIEIADYTPMLARLAQGARFAFCLTANPTYTATLERDDGTTKKVRAAHKTPHHQAEWLLQRTAEAGFEIERTGLVVAESGVAERDLLVAGRTRQRFRRNGRGVVTVDQVTFEGTSVVTDVDRLRATLTGGLGRAKAYGCGLLTLAPAPTVARQAA